jgi:hypothetical protein
MKITLKQIVGLWFAMGSVAGVVISFFKMYNSDASNLSIFLGLFTACCSAYYFGRQWGMLIIGLDAHFKSALKSMVYGVIVGFCTLYFILVVLTISSYLQTKFLSTVRMGHYFQASLELVAIPFLAAFGAIIGLVLEPLVLGLSSMGGLALYLLRHKILHWADNKLLSK